MNDTLAQIQAFLKGLSARQKLMIAGGAMVVALTLWAFVALFDKGKNVTLYSGLRPEDAQAMGTKLAAKNIPYEISADGSTMMVVAEKLDAARLETASQGLPRNARLGFELFDTPNWAGSDFSEKVNYQRALEGELERTLQTLNDVEAVRVHLVMSRDSLFTEQEHEAKAAVIVKTKGGNLSHEAQQAIPQLVASAVDRLRPENVTVVDAETATPFVQKNAGSGRLSFSSDEELAAAAVHAIEPVVGAEHVRASVHVEYDLSTSEDTSETYDPKSAVAVNQQHSEETAGGGAAAGVPGTASNLPSNGVANATVMPAIESQSSKSESTTYAVNRSTKHVVQPAGRVHRITGAILVDDAVENKLENGKSAEPTRRKRSPEEMAAIEKLARAAIGVDEQRGDLLAVENLSFQRSPVEPLAPPSRMERLRQIVQPWSQSLRYLGITILFLIVYGLVLRPVKKQVLEAFRQIPAQIAKAAQPLPAGEAAGIELPVASEEGTRTSMLRKQLMERIKAEPGAASRLVQTWIREPKK